MSFFLYIYMLINFRKNYFNIHNKKIKKIKQNKIYKFILYNKIIIIIYYFIYLSIYLFIHLFIYSFFYLFIHSFIHSLKI